MSKSSGKCFFIPLRWPVFIILAECPFNWPKSSLSDAKLAEGLLSQPSVFGWKIIFEATLAWAMQTFQRPTASKVLNNNWQNEKQKIIVNRAKKATL